MTPSMMTCAYRIGSTWTNILVADTGDVEVNAGAINNQGRVHIVYRDETPGAQKLMYAYYDLNQVHYSTVVIGFSMGSAHPSRSITEGHLISFTAKVVL